MNKRIVMMLGLIFICGIFTYTLLNGHLNKEEETSAKAATEKAQEKPRFSVEEQKKIESFLLNVKKELLHQGYKQNFSFDHRKNVFRIMVEDEKVINKHGDGITELITSLAVEENFGKVEVNFEVLPHLNTEVENKWTELSKELSEVTKETVEDKGYKLSSISLHPSGSFPHIEIEIIGDGEHFEKDKFDIKYVVSKIVSKHTEMDLAIFVEREG
ncbi:hypothetical protein [Salirhabdus sp. Marseille-P4669]|uniref:hypothetical protein n=1 Tax=Salirhabdus sp. Marseille-P4669 TaxID=2042310 RepID=UPI000C7AC834|nr:hypothetical protein [Salirhabdus sp. Marseille-P4669]